MIYVYRGVLDTLANLVSDDSLTSFFEIACIFSSYCIRMYIILTIAQDPRVTSLPILYNLITRGIESNNSSAFTLLSTLLSKSDPPRVCCSYYKIDRLLLQKSDSIIALDCLIYLVKGKFNKFSLADRRLFLYWQSKCSYSSVTWNRLTLFRFKHTLCCRFSLIDSV